MEESALAAPSICNDPAHPHAFARNGNVPRTLRQEGGDALALSAIAHDARNVVTALSLCSELIAEPGVLGAGHGHYAQEIRSIAEVAGQLVRRLSAYTRTTSYAQEDSAAAVADLPSAVQQLRGLLNAVAGPAISVAIECLPCAGGLRLSVESLTRILMNLVRNAADAMPGGGHIRITAQMSGGGSFLWTLPETMIPADSGKVVLAVEDDGPGIPPDRLNVIFNPGYSTRQTGRPWPEAPRRGLGLSIVRRLVKEAGGAVRAVVLPGRGARFEIELPLTKVTNPLLSARPLLTRGGSQ